MILAALLAQGPSGMVGSRVSYIWVFVTRQLDGDLHGDVDPTKRLNQTSGIAVILESFSHTVCTIRTLKVDIRT
jgi:hypothetical protein